MSSSALLDHPLISQRYFFPRRDGIPRPFWVGCGDARLACFYEQKDPDALTIVHFHGNGEIVADYLDGFPEIIERMGGDCFLAEFRGYGGSTGTPQLGKMLSDVKTTIESIGKPPEKLVIFGRSVGSLFAARAIELFPNIAGLVLESAIADPLERLLLRVHPEELLTTADKLEEAVAEQMNIKRAMQGYSGPTLIMHTRNDGLIDVSHAERLAEWSAGETTLEIFHHGSHNDIMFVNGPRYFGLLNEFLDSLRD